MIALTRYTKLYPVHNIQPSIIVSCFQQFAMDCETLRKLVSDRGIAFMEDMKKFVADAGL